MNSPKKIHKSHFLDFSILLPYIFLVIIGLIMVYSSTSYGQLIAGKSPLQSVTMQAVWWGMSLVFIFLIYHMKVTIFTKKRLLNSLMLVVFCMLVYALLFGETINGAKGWIKLPVGGNLQPAEYLKILFVWFLSNLFAGNQDRIAQHRWQRFKQPLLILIVLLGLVVITPDMGNMVILSLTALAVMLASGISFRYAYLTIFGIILSGVAGMQLVVQTKGHIFPKKFAYIYGRFEAMADTFNPDVLRKSGLQLANSYYAMHNGGLFGLGLGNSVQKKGYLPEAHTDFIFAITIEELGLIFSIIILIVLFFMIARMFLVGIRAQKPFNAMMSIGFAVMLLMQTFVNLGGITGLIPSTGVTFPFLSQGGNSLFVLSVAVAFVLNVSADEARLRLEQQAEMEYFDRMQGYQGYN
ncbi:cell division protein FtsW [Pilibacter termitis]|uniref:Probable peptidoglycan glycosyltransferase FtsW n=1 Tax=Pilibacter termitis TaxID=263852 RepID=A0A1T4P0L3_9ENTE|nr:FtsW/RodA/SpoVE family cell cycle protein [Pilibacter termitis]SJZ84786.1 cell division protein FtsW [Pilibacter termitis]